MKKLLLLFLILLLVPVVFSKSGHMPLLAVTEKDGKEVGVIADLYLDIVPGQGRVFIDTFPLTKLDTQMSTRFAKQIACNFLDVNCNNYDFFYTIRARSAIIGGPSASGAATVLTVALLDNLKLDEKIAMTGTINSGGIIGPVGGIQAKLKAAKEANITKVLVPEFSMDENITDYTIDLDIEVVDISSLEDAIYEFTRKMYNKKATLTIDATYQKVMKDIAQDLCNRAKILSTKVEGNSSFIESADEALEKGKDLMNLKKYYSAASYCFTANIKYNFESKINLSEGELEEEIFETEIEIKEFEDFIDKKEIKTLTDLQTFMIVKERIVAAKENLNKSLINKSIRQRTYTLTFAIERLNSAKTWSRFFDTGKKDTIEKEHLKSSCINKLSEAEERLQYVGLYIKTPLAATRKELTYAYRDAEQGDYDLCLFKASKAKADADLILTTLRLSKNQTTGLIDKKLELVKNVIANNKNFFPIIGYSYYEYAGVLKEEDPTSALIFLEYASELSNLDLYFKSEVKSITSYIDFGLILIFSGGLILGIVIGLFIKPKKKSRIKF